MFMVLGLHVNDFALGAVDAATMDAFPFPSLGRIICETLCITAVNIFILLSGWFGIKPSRKGCLKFIFQCVFIVAFMGLIGLVFDKNTTFGDFILAIISPTWFVVSYLILYVVSPILNTFVNTASRNQLRNLLTAFFIIEINFGWIIGGKSFGDGYSALSFIGLYLLARYLKLYGQKFYKFGLPVWLCSSLITVTYCIACVHDCFVVLRPWAFAYSSPFTVAGAAGLIMFFSRIQIKHNRLINFIASSSFAVYLFHMGTGWTAGEYTAIARKIYHDYDGLSYISIIFLFICSVYILAIITDLIRIHCWKICIKSISQIKVLWSKVSYLEPFIR